MPRGPQEIRHWSYASEIAAVSVSLTNLVERVGHERIRPHVAPDRTVRAAGGALDGVATENIK